MSDMPKVEENPMEKTKQYNVRIPLWLIDELENYCWNYSRGESEAVRMLLKDAIFSVKGTCICHPATPGLGKSNMPCLIHGQEKIEEQYKRHHVA